MLKCNACIHPRFFGLEKWWQTYSTSARKGTQALSAENRAQDQINIGSPLRKYLIALECSRGTLIKHIRHTNTGAS